ncbi:MAG: hypothetical protein O3B41_11730 [Bacteroidetes bacterium]|nr:hypothetical protein [Bacteroidota bacterium]
MTFPEILPHLLAGKPVRCTRWPDGSTMAFKNGTIQAGDGASTRMSLLAISLGRDDWEIYETSKAIPSSEVKPGHVFRLSESYGAMKYIKSVSGLVYDVFPAGKHLDQDQKCYPCEEEEL